MGLLRNNMNVYAKSHLPMMHNCVIKFDEQTLPQKSSLPNKYNALKETNQSEFREKKANLIVWDQNSKSWVPAIPSQDNTKQHEIFVGSQNLATTNKDLQYHLGKIDSMSSDGVQSMYDSYYRRIQNSQDGNNQPAPNVPENPIQEPLVIPQSKSLPDSPGSSYPIPLYHTEAILAELVHRNVPMPIVDRFGRQVRMENPLKVGKPTSRMRTHYAVPHQEEEYTGDLNDIYIESTSVPITHKFDEIYKFVERKENEQEKGIDAQPQWPDLRDDMMLQIVQGDRRGYEDFAKQLEKQAKEKAKLLAAKNQSTSASPTPIRQNNTNTVILESKQYTDYKTTPLEKFDSGHIYDTFGKNETKTDGDDLTDVKGIFGLDVQQSFDSPEKPNFEPKIYKNEQSVDQGPSSPVQLYHKYSPQKNSKFTKIMIEFEGDKKNKDAVEATSKATAPKQKKKKLKQKPVSSHAINRGDQAGKQPAQKKFFENSYQKHNML